MDNLASSLNGYENKSRHRKYNDNRAVYLDALVSSLKKFENRPICYKKVLYASLERLGKDIFWADNRRDVRFPLFIDVFLFNVGNDLSYRPIARLYYSRVKPSIENSSSYFHIYQVDVLLTGSDL